MTIYRLVATIAMLAMATMTQGQNVSQFKSASMSDTSRDVAEAVYASLSDMEQAAASLPLPVPGPATQTSEAATARLSDKPVTAYLGDAGMMRDSAVSPASLLGPACGLPGGCSDPGCAGGCVGPSCGIAGPGCGLPGPLVGPGCGIAGIAGPGCGIAAPGCGLAGGLMGEPSCGAALGGCDSGACSSCGVACGSLCLRKCPSCCGVGTHYSNIYGEFLYLRARSAEVTYAVPSDGPVVAGLPTPIQVGNLGVLDPDYEPGFRAGMNIALDTVSSIDVRYTMFESNTQNETSAIAPFVLRSLVTHPSTATASQDGLSSHASLDIDFDLIDVSFRQLFKCCELTAINYVVGARYATLEQNFDSEFVKNGLETVTTDIDFDGAGLRFGLETQRYSCRNQLHVYANGYASFMAGRFRANYFQGQQFDPEVVNAEWEAGRIVPIVDFEAGVGWQSGGGKLSLSAGYMVSAWFNTVTTQDYITAIQSNNYLGLSDTITFDGLQARMAYRF